MATHYSRGRAAEWRLRTLLEAADYQVIRSAGSKGDWDLVALPRINDPLKKVLAIQVKSTTSPGAARRLLEGFQPEYGVNYSTQLWVWHARKWTSVPAAPLWVDTYLK